ncbi:MAG TPA: TldD/PmbA family protein, partial [Candidatus Poseidoniia archaeon]|nr:TldD/PmbA family protein [Candidatus Poseidoniia archaeon]
MKISENELIESCRLAVITAIKKGVDSAEAYSVSSVESEVSIERNDVKLGKFHQGSGIGIRVIKNGALGFSSVNMLCREEINEAVDASIKIASKGSYDQYNILPKTTIPQKLSGIYDREAQYFKSEDSVKNAVEMLKTAKRYDKRVTVDSGAFNNSLNSIAVVNSNGVECVEMVSSFTWYIMGMAVDGEEVSSFDFQFGGSHHLKDIEVESTARNFAENVVNSLGSKKCQPFKGTLILSPHAVAELILPTLVNSVNSNNVQKGRSSLIGKMEKEIACKELTITDDATWSDGLSASSFDREGVPHKKLDIINKGILKS